MRCGYCLFKRKIELPVFCYFVYTRKRCKCVNSILKFNLFLFYLQSYEKVIDTKVGHGYTILKRFVELG